jgi:hypothetical protein
MSWLLFVALAFAENPRGSVRYVVADVVGARFPDADTAGPMLATGDMVIVLFDDGARVRVRKGDGYGWVAAEMLSETAPAEPVQP